VKHLAVLGVSAALACGGSPRTVAPPAPTPGAPTPTATPVTPEARIQYRVIAPLRYEILRFDSLMFVGTGSGAPQVTVRRIAVTLRPDGSRLVLTVDSVAPIQGARLAASSVDSAREARWEVRLSPSGPNGTVRANRSSVLIGQIGAALRLLFPQLPSNGVRAADSWQDSAEYPVQLDAFVATEAADRSSRAERGALQGSVRIEVTERLSRKGKATQGGREMTVKGTGGRQVTYEFSPEGWVTMLRARDSLDLQVAVPDSPDPIPVRQRSTVTARLRGTSPG
jgi:hypothetical protein